MMIFAYVRVHTRTYASSFRVHARTYTYVSSSTVYRCASRFFAVRVVICSRGFLCCYLFVYLPTLLTMMRVDKNEKRCCSFILKL